MFMFSVEVELIDHILLVSGVQQSDSVLYIYIYIYIFLFRFLSIIISIILDYVVHNGLFLPTAGH